MSKILRFAVIVAVAIGAGLGSKAGGFQAAEAAARPANSHGNINYKTWSTDIMTWQPPKEMTRELPYYIAGHDYDNRPVIIMEVGKWDTRKFLDVGGETAKTYDKYVEQFWWRVSNTTSMTPDAEDGVLLIMDCAGFTNRQMATVAAIESLHLSARRSAWAESNVADFIMINVNFAMRTWANVLQSISGPLFGRADMYGSQKELWLPELHRRIPKDQLPLWYGGSKDFKPVQVFG